MKSSLKLIEKSTDKSATKTYNTFLNIPPEVIFNLLRIKIQNLQIRGLIIESLESVFLKQPLSALNGLLYAFGNAKHIQVVILRYAFYNYFDEHFEEGVHEEMEKSGKCRSSVSKTHCTYLINSQN